MQIAALGKLGNKIRELNEQSKGSFQAATEVMGNRLTSPINLAIDSKGHQRTRGIAVEIPHSRASKHSIHIQQNTPMVLYQVESTG